MFYENIESINEALLIGEAAYLLNDAEYISPELGRDKSVIRKLYNEEMDKYEQALLINPSQIITSEIVHFCAKGLEYCRDIESIVRPAQYNIPSIQRLPKTNSSERYYWYI